MAASLREHFDANMNPFPVARRPYIDLQTAFQHLLAAAVEEDVVGQSLRIAFDAVVAGSNVGHFPGWLHVAILALHAALARRAGLPFGIGRIDANAKDGSFVA